jgi:hypothetical protein
MGQLFSLNRLLAILVPVDQGLTLIFSRKEEQEVRP